MPVRVKAATDNRVWGLALNDMLRLIQGFANIVVVLNGNNPPTVKTGTRFWVYKEDTYLTPTGEVTGNNVYPADTSITYPVSEAIFEGADRTFAFGDANFPAAIGASKTYYLWCSGGEDIDETSQGRGVYGMDETAPSWDEEKGGWYNASGYRVIAIVKSTAGSVIDTTSLRILSSYNYESNYFLTTETDTGEKWIDGRTIYRKVISFGTLPNNNIKNVAHGITFTAATTRIIKLTAYATDGQVNSGEIEGLIITHVNPTGVQYSFQLSYDNTNVMIRTAYNASGYTECYVIAEYIK